MLRDGWIAIICLTTGEPGEGKRAVWIVARQHPGESMAEWFMEGMLHALLDPYHGLSKELLKKAVFYVVRHKLRRFRHRLHANRVYLQDRRQSPMQQSAYVSLV